MQKSLDELSNKMTDHDTMPDQDSEDTCEMEELSQSPSQRSQRDADDGITPRAIGRVQQQEVPCAVV